MTCGWVQAALARCCGVCLARALDGLPPPPPAQLLYCTRQKGCVQEGWLVAGPSQLTASESEEGCRAVGVCLTYIESNFIARGVGMLRITMPALRPTLGGVVPDGRGLAGRLVSQEHSTC